MKRWTLILLLLVLAAGLAIGAGVSMLHNGLSAHATPTAMEAMLAQNARRLAIPANARNEHNPVTPSDQNLQEGMAHFADHCTPCHGNDGSGDTLYGKGLYPKPPDLRLAETQKLSDGELFWIIGNGIASLACRALSPRIDRRTTETGTVHSAFAATDDGRTRGDGARQPEIATRSGERLSLERGLALCQRDPNLLCVFQFGRGCPPSVLEGGSFLDLKP
jgi:cytochrome c553